MGLNQQQVQVEVYFHQIILQAPHHLDSQAEAPQEEDFLEARQTNRQVEACSEAQLPNQQEEAYLEALILLQAEEVFLAAALTQEEVLEAVTLAQPLLLEVVLGQVVVFLAQALVPQVEDYLDRAIITPVEEDCSLLELVLEQRASLLLSNQLKVESIKVISKLTLN